MFSPGNPDLLVPVCTLFTSRKYHFPFLSAGCVGRYRFVGKVAVCGEVVTRFVEEVADFGGGSGSWGRLLFMGEVAVHGGGSSLWGGSDL